MKPALIAMTAGFMLSWAGLVHAGERLPAEVQRFIERRDSCDHFRGEIPDPEETQRMNEVLRQIDLSCTGTDRETRINKWSLG